MAKELQVASVATVGALVLQMFYGMVRVRWPANYFSTRQIVDYKISMGWSRYFIFRFTPPFVIAILVCSVALRLQISVVWSAIVCACLHAFFTVGRAFRADVFARRLRLAVLAADTAVLFIIAGAFLLGALSSRFVLPVMPGVDKYIEVALTGITAAILVHYLREWTTGTLDVKSAAERVLAKIPEVSKLYIKAKCVQHRVDPDLAFAIVVTEIIQRPAWFRAIERFPIFRKIVKTHGIMQAAATATGEVDLVSIGNGVEALSGAVLPRQYGAYPKAPILEYHLDRHNLGSEFQQFATEVFFALGQSEFPQSQYVGNDGAPGLRVLQKKRKGEWWVISGDCASEIRYVIAVMDGVAVSSPLFRGFSDYFRMSWTLKVSIHAENVHLEGIGGIKGRSDEPVDCTVKVHL